MSNRAVAMIAYPERRLRLGDSRALTAPELAGEKTLWA